MLGKKWKKAKKGDILGNRFIALPVKKYLFLLKLGKKRAGKKFFRQLNSNGKKKKTELNNPLIGGF